MKINERAKKLIGMGFFEGFDDVEVATLVAEVAAELSDLAEVAPATALLLAGGAVLEIEPEAAAQLDGYAAVLAEVQEFCGDAFEISNVRAELVKDKSVLSAGEEDGQVVSLRFRINGESHEIEVTHYTDMIDLSFLGEINAWLERAGIPQRLCPLLELMDDMARYVYIAPEVMEQAELEEVISAPDFEDE